MQFSKLIKSIILFCTLPAFAADTVDCFVNVVNGTGNFKFRELTSKETQPFQGFSEIDFRLKQLESGPIVFDDSTQEELDAEVAEIAKSITQDLMELPYTLLPDSTKNKIFNVRVAEAIDEFKQAFILLSVALEQKSEDPTKEQQLRYVISDLRSRMPFRNEPGKKTTIFQPLNKIEPILYEVPYKRIDGTYSSTPISINCRVHAE